MKTVEGWWFAAPAKDGVVRLPHGDGREVRVGETLTVTGKIVPCEHGLHASVRAFDALRHAPGAMVARVRLSGTIVEHNGDKLAASERTVLWMADATRTLHEFAVWAARQALLGERRRGREPDKRSWEALRVKALWIRGKATDKELSAAESAARSAAESAARSAAESEAESAQNKRLEVMLNRLPKRERLSGKDDR